ncbi:MAG: right-handed parallel beta-helix repeat-containing protein [Prolixibacteraceae bacterium]|nr:right-handed parallel beta-helix repeat-containing protein [Prolixibacteraceae bacterium]
MIKFKFIQILMISMLMSLGGAIVQARDIYVDQNASNSSDSNSGVKSNPLKTISKAAQIAIPGDRVIVKDGVYREWVKPQNSGTKEKPIVYLAENRHKVIIKGSKIYKDKWINEGQGNIYSTQYDESFFEGYNPFNINRAAKFPDFVDWVTRYSLAQIFVEGQLYSQVLDLDALKSLPQSWFKKENENRIYIHFSNPAFPKEAVIEMSVRPRVFAPIKRGLGYIEVKGFIIEHCSNQYPKNFWESIENAQAGALGCASGHHWVIEDNIVRFANTIGIDCGSETSKELYGYPTPPVASVGYHTIRNNVIELNGCTGITGWNHTGTKVLGNVIRKNNALGIMSWETAGIKFHGFYNGSIEDNLIEQNDTWGIWLDNVYKGSVIKANLIIDNLWGGIFLEMGNGPLDVINNVIAYNISGNEAGHRGGHGIYGHDASGVNVYHNMFYCNSGFGVTSRIVADRLVAGRPAEASRWNVKNNLFIGNKLGNIAFSVPSDRSVDNFSDCNIFLNGGIKENTGFFSLNTAITPTLKNDFNFIEDYLRKRIISKGLSRDECPNVIGWSNIPYLTFKQWKAVLGHDLNSKLLPRNNSTTIRQRLYQFQSSKEAGIFSHRFKKIEGVESDYFGNKTDSQNVYAGPFQGDFEDHIMINMWPKITNASQ